MAGEHLSGPGVHCGGGQACINESVLDILVADLIFDEIEFFASI